MFRSSGSSPLLKGCDSRCPWLPAVRRAGQSGAIFRDRALEPEFSRQQFRTSRFRSNVGCWRCSQATARGPRRLHASPSPRPTLNGQVLAGGGHRTVGPRCDRRRHPASSSERSLDTWFGDTHTPHRQNGRERSVAWPLRSSCVGPCLRGRSRGHRRAARGRRRPRTHVRLLLCCSLTNFS
jgi:hypothetical protein